MPYGKVDELQDETMGVIGCIQRRVRRVIDRYALKFPKTRIIAWPIGIPIICRTVLEHSLQVRTWSFAFFLIIFQPLAYSSTTTYFVAMNGNDSWTGTIASPSGNDGPFKTLAKAQAAVRSQIAAGMTSDITVMIRAGEYPEISLHFNQVDASNNGYKVTYQNYPGEKPLVHAGRRLTGWQLDSGNIYKVPVNWTFHTLYENGARSVKARHPNVTSSNPYVYNRTTAVISGADTTKFGFGAGDIPVVSNASSVEVVLWPGGPDGVWNWDQYTFAGSSIDYSAKVVTVGQGICCGNPTSTPWSIGIGSRYFVQGAMEFLDQPGEFWIGNGYLYYWPLQTPVEQQVIIAPAPQTDTVFDISAAAPVSFNMQIEGLTLGYTDRNGGGISLSNAALVTIHGNEILNTGSNGVSAAFKVQDITITGNVIHEIGGDAINTYGDSGGGYPQKIIISNNHIHHTGQIFGGSNGISLNVTSNALISHNLIHDVPHAGIKGGGDGASTPPVYNAANNTIEYNDISRAVLDVQDSGSIHLGGAGPGIVIDSNRLHDSNIPFSYGHLGVYLDVCNIQATVSNNLIHDIQTVNTSGTTLDAIEIKGSSIAVRNNLIALNHINGGEIEVNAVDTNCPGRTTQGVSIQSNILAKNGTNTFYSFPQFTEMQVGSANGNLFFHDTGTYYAGFGYGDAVTNFNVTTQSLSQWQTQHPTNYDVNSIIADPLFVDPQNRDFRLRPDSPAYALGFTDIDVASIGLTADFPFPDTTESLARLFVSTSQSGRSATARLTSGSTTQLAVSGRTRTGYLVTLPNESLTFSSDQPAVATVNSLGSITAGGAGLATITVTATTAGVAQSTVFFVAVGGDNNVSLAQGWNLMGNSMNAPLTVATTFGDSANVTSVWKWNTTNQMWAFFAPSQSDGGAAYAASRNYETLSTISSGDGFWVNAKQPFTAQLPAGTPISSSSFSSLPTGWSLIATGDNKTPSDFNSAAAGNLTTLWVWDAASSKWYFYAPSLAAQGGTVLKDYATTMGYLDFTTAGKTLGLGVGFWVNR